MPAPLVTTEERALLKAHTDLFSVGAHAIAVPVPIQAYPKSRREHVRDMSAFRYPDMSGSVLHQAVERWPGLGDIYVRLAGMNALDYGFVTTVDMRVANPDELPERVLLVPTTEAPGEKAEIVLVSGYEMAISRAIAKYKIQSLAVPALGCGAGGLDWRKAGPYLLKMCHAISKRTGISVKLCVRHSGEMRGAL